MNLYIIVIHFADHRVGIGQHRAETSKEALVKFIKDSESLDGYDRDKALEMAGMGEERLIHVADGLRGFWIWAPPPPLTEKEEAEVGDIYGGHIVQTDPKGPVR
jgi:hypothetical protein